MRPIQLLADEVFQLDPLAAGEPDAVSENAPASPADPTTATRYPRQWNMRAINAPQVWAAGRLGSPDVTVAILDTGIDYSCPDLEGRVDLSRSISFVPSDDALVATYFPTKHPVTDLHYHGTHVASTAVSNSNIIAGVTTQTTLMGVKVCNVNGSCAFSAIVAGLLHAADSGADVANMSLGGGTPASRMVPLESTQLDAAIAAVSGAGPGRPTKAPLIRSILMYASPSWTDAVSGTGTGV